MMIKDEELRRLVVAQAKRRGSPLAKEIEAMQARERKISKVVRWWFASYAAAVAVVVLYGVWTALSQ